MAVVGRAEVIVRALTEQFKADLRAAFQHAEAESDAAGDRSGERFTNSFTTAFNENLDGFDFDGIGNEAERAGNDSGGRFGQSFKNSSSSELDNAARDIERDLSNIGNNMGNKGKDIKLFDPSTIDLPFGLITKFAALIPLVGALGGALAALIAGLTAMASAAAFAAGALAALSTAMAFVAAGAITGILAFGGIGKAVSALGQQQAKSASDGLSAARKQEAAAKQVEAAQDRVANAQQRLKDATQALKDAQEEQARDAVSDARNIRDAEENLADAQDRARDAQEALTQAREDAKEKLEDLQLQLRGSVLSEEEATLRLQKAREAYQKTLNNPEASQIDREQARIDLEQAELAVDNARDRREDLSKEAEAANKKGVEGSDEVAAAKKGIVDANRDVRDAEEDVAGARQRATDDATRNARAVEKAQRGVADATREVSRAIRDLGRAQRDAAASLAATSAAANKVDAAFKNLSPEAQKFARFLFGLKPVLNDLRAAAGQRLFGPLQVAIQSIVTGFLPTFRRALVITGGGLGQLATQIAAAFNVSAFKDNFTAISEGFLKVDPKTHTNAFQAFGNIVGNALRGITGLARAAQPVFLRFMHYIERITGSFAKKFEGDANLKKMTDLISRMGDAAATIGSIFGNTFRLIRNVMSAALPVGLELNSTFAKFLGDLVTKTKSGTPGFEKLKKFFVDIRPLFISVAKFLGELGKQFLLLGQDAGKGTPGGGIKKAFDDLRKNLPVIRSAIETFTQKTAPALVHGIMAGVKAFKAFAESPAVQSFLFTIGLVGKLIQRTARILNTLHLGGAVGTISGVALAFKAITGAMTKLGFGGFARQLTQFVLAPLKSLVRFIGGQLLGAFTRLYIRLMSSSLGMKALAFGTKLVQGAMKLLRLAMATALGPVGLIIIGIAALVAGFIYAYKHSKTFHDIVDKIGRALKKFGEFVLGVVVKAFQFLRKHIMLVLLALGPMGIMIAATIFVIKHFSQIVSGIGNALKKLGDFIVKVAVEAFKFLKKHIQIVLLAFGPLGIAISAIIFAFKHFDEIKKIVGIVVNAVVDFFKKLPGRILSVLSSIGSTIGNFLRNAFNLVINVVSTVVGAVVGFFTGLPGRILRALATIGTAIANFLRTAWSGLTTIASNVVSGIVGFFTGLGGRILTGLKNIGSSVAGAFRTAFGGLKGIVSGVIDDVVGFFRGLPGRLLNFVTGIASAAGKIGKSIFDGVKSGVTGAIGAAADLGKAILGGFAKLVNTYVVDKINNAIPNDLGFTVLGKHIAINLPDNPIPRLPELAAGGTILPRAGGTLALLAEAGRAETVVDTGLINRRLRSDETRTEMTVEELRRIRDILERMSALGGLNIENFNVPPGAPGERVEESAPRGLRRLAFELGV